jgi:probable phosphoglycerate mutase
MPLPLPLPTPLLVIRHGETDWNASGRLQGRQDIPLNARGRAQAQAVGLALRERYDIGPFACLSSPLQRASETLELILAQLPGTPRSLGRDARLAEKAFGDWEGLDMPTIAQRYPEQHASRAAEPYTFRVPGGESYADAAERVRPLLEALDGPTLLVAHGALIRSLLVATGLASAEVATRMVIHQGRWLELTAEGYRWYSAAGWGEQP